MERGLVEKKAMGQLAMLAQAFAVVGGHGHHGLVREALALQLFQQAAHLRVHLRDLAVVGTAGMARRPGRRRHVGSVGVVEMDPEEERPGVVLQAEPGERPVHHVAPRPLRLQGDAGVGIAGDLVVIHLEALVEPEAAVEHEGADEGARAVPLLGKHGRQGALVRRVGAEAVVAQPMVGRQQAGEDAGVGRQGQRHLGRRAGEADALGRQAVQPGGYGVAVSIAAQVVGPYRVQGHQDEVGVPRLAPPATTPG